MADQPIETSIELGASGVRIPAMGLGAWAWGDKVFWGFGSGYEEDDVRQAFETSVAEGIYFVDTAEVYGSGTSERLTGKFIHEHGVLSDGKSFVVATKFFPFPWRWRSGSVPAALKRSLKRLNMEQVDLYQIHQPFPPFQIDTWAHGLVSVIKEGLSRAVGVSNFNVEQTRRTYEILAHAGFPLASNQVEYSLLDRKIEKSGLYRLCKELGIAIIAYSPIAKGVLTGKYTPQSPPPGIRGRIYNREMLEKAQPLLRLMREIGRAHESKSLSQVALNWTICKGTIPIPGAKNARQAQENAGALGWRLTEEEMTALDEASASFS